MMESLRLPIVSRAESAAPAQGEFGSTQGFASEPTIRKLMASGSASGKSGARGPVPGVVLLLPTIVVSGIVGVVTTLLIIGVKESANVNTVIVFIKLVVVLMFIALAAKAVNPANWHPFIPPNAGSREQFGTSGIVAGAGIVFFAYIGFDAVSTAAQEAKNPQRDMPRGIIGSLLVCTVLYIIVSLIATGIVPYRELDVPAPIALAADRAGLGWISTFISLGAIAGLSSVILVQLMAQSRVFYSMARDGLLPAVVNKVHPKFRTPYITSIVTGVAVAIPAAILPLRDAAKLVSIGTLSAFVIVSIGILVLRVREPDLERPFKTPWIWFTAPMGAISALYLMLALDVETWIRLLAWFLIGLVIYLGYGYRNSRLNNA